MAKPSEIEEVLKSLSKEELIRIIVQVAGGDDAFKNGLIVKYAKGDHSKQIQSCKRAIDSIVKKYVGREHFIPYRETYSFAMDMLALLENTNGEQDESLALEIAVLVLEEGIAAFQYADDSNGDIGMLVEEVLECIREIASSLDQQELSVRMSFFERLLSVSESGIFQGWEDFQISIFHICAGFADVEKLREQLEGTISNQIVSNANDSYQKYSNEALHKILFQLIQQYGSKEEANKFVSEHLHFTYFRELAINISMESLDYRRAIELAEEGEKQDQQLPGLIIKWQAARLEVYEKLSLKKEQELLARELLLKGDYRYYHYMELIYEGDKDELYRDIIAELKESNNWKTREVYLRLISDKKDIGEMMTYVGANPSEIEKYAARLFADYSEEVERIYSNYISDVAGSASSRKEYQNVCAMLKRYKYIVGKGSQIVIILQLKAEYNKRPAFLDELAKLM
ncbi:hypothetical protein [Cohnella abietis]|uniref:Uncharacterized protein n=1 Tax=Cohnella abietis TaxID=2507935 RepID=A0A3T1DCE0_9BACL|nr:hypothetical protein [Cohnella abietis]BBI35605.1 hypothetical protein KCTCHS21_50040 [Cohnella abietis]